MQRPDRKRTSTRRSRLEVEGLEERQLLSAARVAHDTIVKALSVEKAIANRHVMQPLANHVVSTAKTTDRLLKVSTKTVGGATNHITPAIVPVRSSLLSDYIIYPRTPFYRSTGQVKTYLPPPGTISPSQMQTAYGINQLPLSNEGQGVTIGIVDELVDPTITSDLATFSTEFHLPQLDGVGGDGSFQTINDTAFGTPGNSPAGGPSIETALDVEWAHAMAPKASIVLVFVPATGDLNNVFAEILHGVQLAATPSTATSLGLPPVVAISTSYGYFEGTHPAPLGTGLTATQETTLNNTYLNTGAATNVALTFSAGDYSLPLFPAVSPNVIAVGGTSLYIASARGHYGYELPWGGINGDGAGGGGISSAFGLPSFQSNAGLTYTNRAIPDISMDADPITGVPVYSANDKSVNGGDPWFQIGGTSLASPLFAGVIALAQQDRVDASESILNSVDINSMLYSAYTTDYSKYFHDIVLGIKQDMKDGRFGNPHLNITGYNAAVGYDLASGIGSPIGNEIVSLLNPPPV